MNPAPQLVSDPDRREELARLCLRALGLLPAGETAAQAQDRLTTLSTAERQRVIREAREAERRAQKIREAMVKKAAEEAAAKYMRDHVLSPMSDVRKLGDKLEGMVADDLWPLPTYREMLFIR